MAKTSRVGCIPRWGTTFSPPLVLDSVFGYDARQAKSPYGISTTRTLSHSRAATRPQLFAFCVLSALPGYLVWLNTCRLRVQDGPLQESYRLQLAPHLHHFGIQHFCPTIMLHMKVVYV
jgi:hypothetical protein